jgi:transposase
MSDVECVLVEPMIPPGRRGGCPRCVNLREVLNAIFYVLGTGCQWQALPKDLRVKSTALLFRAPTQRRLSVGNGARDENFGPCGRRYGNRRTRNFA